MFTPFKSDENLNRHVTVLDKGPRSAGNSLSLWKVFGSCYVYNIYRDYLKRRQINAMDDGQKAECITRNIQQNLFLKVWMRLLSPSG